MLIDLNTVNYIVHELIFIRTHRLQTEFPVFSVPSTNLFYIIGPFFLSHKSLIFILLLCVTWQYPVSHCNICTCTFGPLFYILFNFSTWQGRGGEVSDPTLGNRNGCMRYLYQGKKSQKISSGYIFHPPPHIMLYICQDT